MERTLGEPAPPQVSALDPECLPLCLRLWGSDLKSLIVFFPYSFLRALASLSIRNPLQNKFCFPHSLYFTQDAHKQSLQIWQQSTQPLSSDVVTNSNENDNNNIRNLVKTAGMEMNGKPRHIWRKLCLHVHVGESGLLDGILEFSVHIPF